MFDLRPNAPIIVAGSGNGRAISPSRLAIHTMLRIDRAFARDGQKAVEQGVTRELNTTCYDEGQGQGRIFDD
jgi:hypothetical protein